LETAAGAQGINLEINLERRRKPQSSCLHSYVTPAKIYCVYIALMIRDHAKLGGFPANRISEVKLVIDPASSEA
jgi:hypothetical protein